MKKNILVIVFIFGCCFSVLSQETKTEEATVLVKQTTVDACAKSFDEVLALRTALNTIKDELATNKELRAKEEAYNDELLKAVSLLVSSEKRDKGFFRKLIEQIGKVLKIATKAEHLTTIAALIVLLRKL